MFTAIWGGASTFSFFSSVLALSPGHKATNDSQIKVICYIPVWENSHIITLLLGF